MTIKLLASALLLAAACGDNLHPVDDHTALGTDDGAGSSEETPTSPAIDASIYIENPSCDAAIAAFEAGVRYAADGSPVPATDFTCLWTFDDGTTSTDCAGQHEFAAGGDHDFALEVTDLAGNVTRATARRYVYPALEANLEVQGGDRTITWNATATAGASIRVTVDPAELVYSEDPLYYLNPSFTVEVLRDGAYTVRLDVEDEREVGPICTKRIEKQLNVYCTGGEHTHTH